MSIINVKNLTFRYDGSLNNVFENVSFNIDTDWKLGLIGRNGKGKTTFLKLLLGEYEYKGTITNWRCYLKIQAYYYFCRAWWNIYKKDSYKNNRIRKIEIRKKENYFII